MCSLKSLVKKQTFTGLTPLCLFSHLYGNSPCLLTSTYAKTFEAESADELDDEHVEIRHVHVSQVSL